MEDSKDVKAVSKAISRKGPPAPVARMFGWIMLGILVAFLLNNILITGYGFTGPAGLFAEGSGSSAFVTTIIYLAALAFGVLYVLRTPNQSLRWDADKIHRFNVYFISGCFWAVLFVGITDTIIGLMRIENLLGVFFSSAMVTELGRVQFVGPYIHIPLVLVGFVVALFTRTLGFTWLALLIVAAELLIVISRFVFSYEQALMADLVRYWYAALFLFASAYTLYDEGHVRVDILYASFGRTRKGFFNSLGTIALGMTTCWVILAIGFGGKQAIINSPVMNFEITQSGSTGLFIKYQMALFLGIFAISMLVQFVSYFFESVADYRDEPGHREVATVSH
jgi:TRAP-type mannitol/chloroaromatic compound transport system permease small subunit